MPKIRSGCRSCCWTRKSSSIPAKHPFYLHGAAEKFIAYRDGVPQGRILVSDDPRYNAEHKSNTGCFGMFESADDPEMAQGLIETASKWLRDRGRTAILGPIDYSTNYNCGLLVEGFDTPPRIMDNHNPPYYAGLLESCGLVKAKDLFSWWFLDPKDMGAMWRERAERIMRRGKITIRSFNERDFDAEVQRCNTVYNGAMEHNWGFVSLTEAEFRYMAGRLKELAEPKMVLLAEVDGYPVGFSITLPDMNEAVRPLNGRLFPYGLPINVVRFLWRRRHIKTARMIVLDVLEKYRRRGIAEMLILKTLDYRQERGPLYGCGARLDPGRQLPREPDHRGRGGQEVQGLPDLREVDRRVSSSRPRLAGYWRGPPPSVGCCTASPPRLSLRKLGL